MEELNNPKPNNYLLLAIFSTLCCCLPLGICAIIRSIKVNDYYSKKQYDAAEAASADAKKVYTHATAAVKRGVDEVMKTVTNIRENCQDISADADEINEKRFQEAEAKMIEDAKEVLRAAEEKAEGAEA